MESSLIRMPDCDMEMVEVHMEGVEHLAVTFSPQSSSSHPVKWKSAAAFSLVKQK